MVTHRLLVCLILLLPTLAFADLTAEKATLHRLQIQHAKFSQLGKQLQHTIDSLAVDINAAEGNSNEHTDAVNKAQHAVDVAKAAYQHQSSLINKSRLENAQFRYAIALRRYEKSDPAKTALIQERNELLRAKRSNDNNIAANQAQIRSQVNIVRQLEITKRQQRLNALETRHTSVAEASKEIKTTITEHGDKRSDMDLSPSVASLSTVNTEEKKLPLKSDRKDHNAVLQEVKRLRDELAQQKQDFQTSQGRTLSIDEIETNTLDYSAQPFRIVTEGNDVTALIEVYSPQAPHQHDTQLLDKFLAVKSYENNLLVQRQTFKLLHLGEHLFEVSGLSLRSGEVALVIGNSQWHSTLSDDYENVTVRLKLTPDTRQTIAVYTP